MGGHPVSKGADHSLQFLLGQVGLSSVDVHHPEAWFDLNHGRCRGLDASGEHGRPAARQGQGRGELAHVDVHASAIAGARLD